MSTILISKKAPNFTAPAVLENNSIINEFNLYEKTKDKYVVLFFYPLNFTFVCPTELISINNRINKFKNLNTEIISISVDSQFSHYTYRNTPIKNGGIGPVKFTMVSDVKHTICKSYEIEHPNEGISLRGTFIIDKNRIIRHQSINDLPIGRNIDEILRILNAIQTFEINGNVCPAGWKNGNKTIEPSSEGIIKFLQLNSETL
ncbi:alkyl hydroperoxide reductase [Candidatus Legionella polyplacis]|uniref:Thioredoxin peroxidase n=1 Tax=Candidatus Legionella polyplacis TaxID=2005262 RepID=A0ABZ2GZ01_9GAMM|nr:peroxiredoxin [Candidatus Legionella polyplacis]ATW01944.1 alkyl hydroperoxide reductase [Candidatus Legionella polyplacis]